MRWLFAMLIALFCWASSVSGENLYAEQTTAKALVSLAFSDRPQLSPDDPVSPSRAELRRKAPGKLLLLLPRVQPFSSSLLSPAQQVPTYTLATGADSNTKPQRQADSPAPNWLAQINWALHSSQQQSRISGWKDSNILYRGSVTYHL
ncbi:MULTISPECIES: hypothetical protein [unclassified Serratia (in: enterobacteria)]|uniref:hypothetical protein n=1 Tax=unclassified Serratia (in: enterobacteria) TaxID=2647522 RepID=UPI0005017895|nr:MULTISPECIES: hypothetical protein [unclassified Serratia (in: enterobacteria)]KFK95402.1 lipoprotein [Serratia sp. Ag2]KFK98750.1 lipoprotein [Serratia sp. Ag1]